MDFSGVGRTVGDRGKSQQLAAGSRLWWEHAARAAVFHTYIIDELGPGRTVAAWRPQ